uniref:Uncharacterized protein n=1 Tax=Myotis myotis TaxID=51298 RepID=A0A7J7Y0S5_MYOMY|nr:hypothetical protein mMyoMyo1_011371 [Myotis myotis]
MKEKNHIAFHQDGTKSEEGSSCPSQSSSQSKGFEGKESSAERHAQTHAKNDLHTIHLPTTQDIVALKAAQISLEEHPQEKQARPICHHQVAPGHLVSLEEDGRQYTCVHCGCQGQQADYEEAL